MLQRILVHLLGPAIPVRTTQLEHGLRAVIVRIVEMTTTPTLVHTTSQNEIASPWQHLVLILTTQGQAKDTYTRHGWFTTLPRLIAKTLFSLRVLWFAIKNKLHRVLDCLVRYRVAIQPPGSQCHHGPSGERKIRIRGPGLIPPPTRVIRLALLDLLRRDNLG